MMKNIPENMSLAGFKIMALGELEPNAGYNVVNDVVNWHSENENPMPSDSAVETKALALQAEHVSLKYQRDRKSEYDVLNQLELMTDDTANSTTTHATAIGVIKTKWPKDNSGPIE